MFSKSKRSDIMSRIRSKNTKAEVIAFRYLRRNKIYFQKHYDRIAGKPDIALPRKKKAVFIDGDFWHGRHPERIEKLPKEYWKDKITKNVERDKKNSKLLQNEGWQIHRVWERDIVRKRTRQQKLDEIKDFLQS